MLRRLLLSLAVLLACHRSTTPAPEPTPQPAEPVASAAEPAPAPTKPAPAPAGSVVREATALQPGDMAAALAQEGVTTVDPSATFRVAIAGRSEDARLALHDAADAAVPSSSGIEIGETTVLTLSPSAPLVPGSRYQVRLDGAVTRELHIGDRSFTPATYAVQAAGEPPPAHPPPRKRSRKG
jgi:hypothetical protein